MNTKPIRMKWRQPVSIFLRTAGCLLMLYITQAQSSINIPPLTLTSAVELAVGNNPSLAEVQARYEAMAEIPSQVSALPDPMLQLNLMNMPTDSFDFDQEPMTQIQFGVTQAIPFPGKLSLRHDAAQAAAMAAAYSVDELRLDLINRVRESWWRLYYLDRALETTASNQALLRQFIEVATTKYETGQGLQQDVLLAQLELSKLMDQHIQLRSLRLRQSIKLNILMNTQPNQPIRLPSQVSTQLPDIKEEAFYYEHAESSRPLLKQAEHQLASAQSQLDLAKRDHYPDFSLGLTYGDRQGSNALPMGGSRSDFLSLMIGVKIPLYAGAKQSKAVKQRSSEFHQNRYALLDDRLKVMAEISNAITDYQRSREQFNLFEKGIVPQAQQTVESMLAGYQVNQVDFLNLVRSQITLFNYELQYWKTLSEAKQALSSLEAAVGEDTIYE